MRSHGQEGETHVMKPKRRSPFEYEEDADSSPREHAREHAQQHAELKIDRQQVPPAPRAAQTAQTAQTSQTPNSAQTSQSTMYPMPMKETPRHADRGRRVTLKARFYALVFAVLMATVGITIMGIVGVPAVVLAVASAIFIAILTPIGIIILNHLTDGTKVAIDVANAIAEGELDKTIEIKGNDEIADMADALSRMIEYLKNMAQAMQKVSQGDLTTTVRPKSEKDILGNVLSGMVESLRRSVGEIREKIEYLNEIPTPVMAIDKDLTVQYINPAGASVVGRSPEDCVGQKCFSMFFTTNCNTRKCQAARAMQMDRIITEEAVANLPFGDIPMRFTAAPIKGADGTIVGALEYATDITKEVEAVTAILDLVQGATNGDLRARADVEQYEGNFRKMVQGVNDALDAVLMPIDECTAVLENVAINDLTAWVKGDYKGDHSKIKDAVNATVHHLATLVAQIKTSADSLARASDQLAIAANQASEATQQVASTSQEMARGAGEQASSSQETAKAVEQLSSVIDEIAQGAQDQAAGFQRASASIAEVSEATEYVAQNAAIAAQSSKSASEAAKNGADLTMKTVTGMETIMTTVNIAASKVSDLGVRSAEIGKIVAVIDDIAAQTNLLALNAAIEAARAGEQGRGFAVVSDEVRKLAERTGTATKEIADLVRSVQFGVDESVKAMEVGSQQVKDGYKLASEAGQALEDILKAVTDVSDLIERISTLAQHVSASANDLFKIIESVGKVTEQNTKATEQMSNSAAQVAKSIDSVAVIAEETSTATQEVSATAEEMNAQVEEMVASSESLRSMAEDLLSVVATFRVGQLEIDQTEQETEKPQPYIAVDTSSKSTVRHHEVITAEAQEIEETHETRPKTARGDQAHGRRHY